MCENKENVQSKFCFVNKFKQRNDLYSTKLSCKNVVNDAIVCFFSITVEK